MSSHYTLLGVEPGASQETIEAAYARQRERYNPGRVADLDPELRGLAAERSAELERAYAILRDPERRRQYDASLGGPGRAVGARAAERRGLTSRERMYAAAGVVAALALIATIWVLTGRDAATQAQPMGEVNRVAPAFEVPALDGGTVSLDAYKGQVVLLNFWATWCEPCKRELPALEAAHQELGDQGLAIIGVNLTDDELVQGRDQTAIAEFLAQYGVTYPTALDLEGEVTNAYRVFPLPTSFFIDGEGRIRYVHIGELTRDDVQARFLELKEEASASRAP
ncbi:MAG TPA: redoxin domain-containing protein [Chloroflexaceae bacterium]|nr:redoxin domain-containing protein [Chloroflexaceae bacterium]